MGSVNLATDRPHGRFYVPANPPAASLGRERCAGVMPFSDATERAWMERQANIPAKELFTQADRDHALRHLMNPTAPLLGFTQVEKDYDAQLRHMYRTRNEIQGGQLYFKATDEFGARATLTESNAYAIHTLGHRWAGHQGPRKVWQYLRQFYHPIALTDCEWIKGNCCVCSINEQNQIDLMGADSEPTSSLESGDEETKIPAPEPRRAILESPEVRRGLDSSPYFYNRRQMTASPTTPPGPAPIRNRKLRPLNNNPQPRFHFSPKNSARARSSSPASAETPSQNPRLTRKEGPAKFSLRNTRSMALSSKNTQSRALKKQRR
jgi:hypothetical protein